ncbi:alcohol dehydrogenase catalytic domain-containing protein, partial [Amycolatopsis pithecellobii]
MRAAVLREFGPPEVLRVESVPTPRPGKNEVLVQVAAVSVGRLLDVVARAGRHPWARFTFPHVLGAEHAGLVAATGAGVTTVEVGDRVASFPLIVDEQEEMARAGFPELSPTAQLIGTHRPGADAEYVCVPEANVRVVPDGVTASEAAATLLGATVAMTQFERAGG